MKKVVLILFLLAMAATSVFAQSNAAIADLRKELHAYIDAIPVQNLSALKPLLAILAESPPEKNELYEILDAIPPRNIDAVKALLLALADPSNTAAVTSQPQAKPTEAAVTATTSTPAATTTNVAATKASAPAKTDEPVKEGKYSIGGGAFFDWSLKNGVEGSGIKMGLDLMSFGAYGFLDAKSFEVSIGPSYGMMDFGGNAKLKLFQLDLNFLWKYPIDLSGGMFSVFPMLGLSYNHPLLLISGNNTMVGGLYDLGQLGFLVGAGLDYNLTSALYLRGEGLFHLRAPFWGSLELLGKSGVTIDLGMGPRIKVGVGYRL